MFNTILFIFYVCVAFVGLTVVAWILAIIELVRELWKHETKDL